MGAVKYHAHRAAQGARSMVEPPSVTGGQIRISHRAVLFCRYG